MTASAMRTPARILIVLALFVGPASSAVMPVTVREFAAERAAYYAGVFGISIELVDAVIQVESDWNPYAVSIKGAAGLMQLMPQTAIRFGVRDRFNIEENIRGGVAYLASLIHLFQGDLRLAIAAYQVGESQILMRGLAYSSREVFEYVSRVAQAYRFFRGQDIRRVSDGSSPSGGG